MTFSYKTAISFGLVYVPITLHLAVRPKDIGFNMLHKKTGERIRYNRTCENCPPHVATADIVKGFQYEKGKYVTLTTEEINKIKTEKNKSIEIELFVGLDEIDPIYYEKSYFVKPTGAEKAFLLIKQALADENKVGLAKTVLGTKEQLVALRVIDGNMVLNTMHFHDEVQDAPAVATKEKVTAEELKLAKQVIKSMTKKFKAENFKDEYRAKLKAAIDQKIAGKKIIGEKKKKADSARIVSLMDALKASVKTTSNKETGKKGDAEKAS